MNIILCGYNWTGCKALETLNTRKNYNIFVYTHETPDYIPSVLTLCKKENIPYSLEKISKDNLPFVPDIIISIYYRYVISNDIINLVQGRIMNLHPSLLPKYRGCSSVTWALINGESEYGFTYHYIDKGIDTGNIILQRSLPIEGWDTQYSLYSKVMYKSMEYFNEAFELLVSGYKGIEQNGEPTYYKRGCPFDGIINDLWTEDMVERFIRAMHFPPYKGAEYNGQEVKNIEQFYKIKNSNLGKKV